MRDDRDGGSHELSRAGREMLSSAPAASSPVADAQVVVSCCTRNEMTPTYCAAADICTSPEAGEVAARSLVRGNLGSGWIQWWRGMRTQRPGERYELERETEGTGRVGILYTAVVVTA